MNRNISTIIVLILLLIPLVVFFMVWDYYAINIPKWDDHSLKAFIVEMTKAEHWQQQWVAITKQHNEHRIALTRLIAWADYQLAGALNYRHLMIAGNLLLLAAFPLFFTILKRNKKPLFALVPIPFLWLTLAFWENMYWGMASVQNFGVITLVLWTIYWAIQPGNGLFALSLLMACLTVLTSGNGLMVLPIVAVLLFLSRKPQRLAIWVVMSAGAIFCYFYWYNSNVSNPATKAGLFDLLKGYMAFLGAFAESVPVPNSFQVCILVGSALFLVAISITLNTLYRLSKNKYGSRNEKILDLFSLGALMFILGTAVVVVYSRAGFGLEGLITSRFKIYSVLLLIIAYLYIVVPIRGSFLCPYISAITLMAVIFNIFSYHFHLVDAVNLRKMLSTDQFNWTYTNKKLELPPETDFAQTIMAKTPVNYTQWFEAIKLADKQGYAGPTQGLSALLKEISFKESPLNLQVNNVNFTSQRLQDSGVYILLSNKDRYYVYPTYRTRNRNRKQLFLKQYYFAPGFYSEVPFNQLTKGTYKLGIIRQEGDKIGILFQNETLNVPEVKVEKIEVNW
ncbi:hypothetical protein CLV98_110122 [Dyadobacter jejuensis]|uniref:Glucosyltransferase GtrII-like protein n=1 Tax=Dyadobacter jejuensis TaxID=1082580 RepID=A0A316AGQ5_9BACT|nr:hypothetical protein [Dyadobacter jejuensis]PWJ56811.1 hypothetical protein CLV98_110122 [Dyadobacter jejuensis]